MSTEKSVSPRLRTALEWADNGYRVFPLRPGTKNGQVLTSWKTMATTDRATICRWWAEEDYNVACALDSDHCVADTDGVEAEQAWRSFDGPRTYTVRTPRGGHHYHLTGQLPNTASKYGPGFDTRGAGGYVLLPGSFTADGAYTIAQGGTFAALPGQLAALASKPAVRAEPSRARANGHYDEALALQRALEWLGKQPVPQAGARDNATFELVARLRDFGVEAHQAQELIEGSGNGIAAVDLERILVSVYERGNVQNKEPGTNAPIGGASAFQHVEIPQEKPSAGSPVKTWFTPEEDMDKTPTTKWIIPSVLPLGGTVIIVGETGSFKSFLAQMLALGIAAGVNTWGHDVEKGVALYAALEGLSGVKGDRRRAWKEHHKIEAVPGFYAGPAPNVSDRASCEAFKAEAMKLKPRVIVMETVSKLMAGLNEDKASDMVIVTAFMDELVAACGCTVIAIHHKSDKVGAADIRGSSALKAGVDTVLEVARQGKGMVAVVTSTKQKDDADGKSWAFKGKVAGPSLVFEPCAIPTAGAGDSDKRLMVRAVLEASSWIETHVLVSELEKRDAQTNWVKVLRDGTRETGRRNDAWKALYERKGGVIYWRIKEEGEVSPALVEPLA